jgi:PPM family protein phosphatase
MTLPANVRFFAGTDVGKVRKHNEDNYLIDRKLGLFVVADGMGGHAAGEIASALAVHTLHDDIRRERDKIEKFENDEISSREVLLVLETAVQRACALIYSEAQNDAAKRGMGTTLSGMLMIGNKCFIAHVGDSRVYMLRNDTVQQITEDHTVSNELTKRGKLTKEQIGRLAQRNAITRAVGIYERVEVDTLLIESIPGDCFLICSDGLCGYFENPEELKPYLTEPDGDTVIKSLLQTANNRGGRDNITGLIIRVGAGGVDDEIRARRVAQKRHVLAQMPMFARLSERELLRVMQVAYVREFGPDEVVIKEGERGDELFIVLNGTLRVRRGEAELTVLGPGDHVGEMALIRPMPRSATVLSEGPVEVISLKRADFFEILRKEHELGVKLLWQFLGVLAARLDQTSKDLRTAIEGGKFPEEPTEDIFPARRSASPTNPAPSNNSNNDRGS